MKFFSFFLFIFLSTSCYSQLPEWSFRIGPTLSKTNIIDNGDGFFFDIEELSGFELLETVEFGLSYTVPIKTIYELEFGLRWTSFDANLAHFQNQLDTGFIGGGFGEQFVYYNLSLGIKRPLPLTKRINFVPSVEFITNIVDQSFLNSLGVGCVIAEGFPISTCGDAVFRTAPNTSVGIGVGGEFEYNIYKGLTLKLWGKRAWRFSRGWGFDYDLNFISQADGQIVDSHSGSVESVLNNWSFGLGFGISINTEKRRKRYEKKKLNKQDKKFPVRFGF